MSWTPNIWITLKDFYTVEHEIPLIEAAIEIWEFNIFDVSGVAISCGNSSSAHREFHQLLYEYSIEHWLLSSEVEECDLCHGWGDKLYDYGGY